MKNITSRILPRIQSKTINLPDCDPKWIYPSYDGLSIYNLIPSIFHWLGNEKEGGVPLDDEVVNDLRDTYQNVILLVVDGLGWLFLQKFIERDSKALGKTNLWTKWLSDVLIAPITSVVPSTTSAALTTLWTGMTPADHGIIGYEVWLKEYSVVANMIFQSAATFSGDTGGLRRAGFKPEEFLDKPVLGEMFTRDSINSFAFQPIEIIGSGLSRMLMKDSILIPYRSLSDLWITLGDVLESNVGNRNYIYIYWDLLDNLSHRFGPWDPRAVLEFESFSMSMEHFFEHDLKLKGKSLFIITGDHGQIYTPKNSLYEVRNHDSFMKCLSIIPTGENRFSYLFPKSDAGDQVIKIVGEIWKDDFIIIPSNEILNSGLMGENVNRRVKERTGELIAIPRENAYWWWADKKNSLLGRHGGLSFDEMVVPFVAKVF